MKRHEIFTYAASWGSCLRPGDPGACMYAFHSDGLPVSEDHRLQVLQWCRWHCRPLIARQPQHFEPYELDKMNEFIAFISSAPLHETRERVPA